jgi:hypothetical protein
MQSRLKADGVAIRQQAQHNGSRHCRERERRRRLRGRRGHATFEHASRTLEIGDDAQAIILHVRALDPESLGERYHELVDKRLQGKLDFAELFELERIEARLDIQDRDEPARFTTLSEDWRRERNKLVTSIEHVLARLKATN